MFPGFQPEVRGALPVNLVGLKARTVHFTFVASQSGNHTIVALLQWGARPITWPCSFLINLNFAPVIFSMKFVSDWGKRGKAPVKLENVGIGLNLCPLVSTCSRKLSEFVVNEVWGSASLILHRPQIHWSPRFRMRLMIAVPVGGGSRRKQIVATFHENHMSITE